MLALMLDTGLKFYAVPLQLISVILEVKVTGLEKIMVKVLAKVFRSLYLLDFELDFIDTLPDATLNFYAAQTLPPHWS